MATGTLISVQEYLSTAYSPDCDYVDGEVVERNLGEKDHSKSQGRLFAFLFERRRQWGIHVYPEQRVQVMPTRFRVPDICVIAGPEPDEQIFTSPPFICIEILSSADRWSQVQEKINDYLSFGVRYVWVIDPWLRKAFANTSGSMHEVPELRTEDPEIIVPLAAILEE
jgi:Uma2 family endonuclease